MKPIILQERYITVGRIHYDYRPKDYPANMGNPVVPWIQMKGYWLEQAGFLIGCRVKVQVIKNRLILTTMNTAKK